MGFSVTVNGSPQFVADLIEGCSLLERVEQVGSIQAEFERFHKNNPKIYSKLVDLAIQAKANGHKNLGMKLLWERLRWFFTIETKRAKFDEVKLNNSYTSRYARLIMQQEPALAGFFRTRKVR